MRKRKKSDWTIWAVMAVAIALVIGSANSSIIHKTESMEGMTEDAIEAKFYALSQSGTNFCAGPTSINVLPDDGNLQGSCCSPMDLHMYMEQLEGLEKYSDYEIIPSDPYDVPVEWAREMIDYNQETALTTGQQAIYDEAMDMSHEGPCCCKCWHWYAYEGLAKKLIIDYGFSAGQIAEVWDLSDACGGSGHADDHGEMDRETFEPTQN